MSGRVRTLLADGRYVTGYRKTFRIQGTRQPHTPSPDWTLTFVLPPQLGYALCPGPFPGVLGAHVGDLGEIRISGKGKDWVLGKAADVLRSKLFIGRVWHRISAVLARADEPGPTLSGPTRAGTSFTCDLVFDGKTTAVVVGQSFRRI